MSAVEWPSAIGVVCPVENVFLRAKANTNCMHLKRHYTTDGFLDGFVAITRLFIAS